MYNIAILEDDAVFRQTLEEYLINFCKYKVCFSDGEFKSFMNNLKVEPDFVLLDNHLTDAMGVEIIEKIKKKFNNTYIIIITGDFNKNFLLRAFENGASAYLLKPFNIAELKKVIETVTTTGSFLEPELLTELLGLINKKKASQKTVYNAELTQREFDILNQIIDGNTYKEMAQNLNVSYHTVNYHLKNIYLKSDVRSKTELLAKFFKH